MANKTLKTKTKGRLIGGAGIGLRAYHINRNRWSLTQFQYIEMPNGEIKIRAVSGHNLNPLNATATVSREDFDSRPQSAISDVEEFDWCADYCGMTRYPDEDDLADDDFFV